MLLGARSRVGALLLLGALPAAVQAKEVTIRCEVAAHGRLATGKVITTPGTADRYYVLDDSSKTLVMVFDGVRKKLCEEGSCGIVYTDTAVSWSWVDKYGDNTTGSTKGKIDRLSGKLTETIDRVGLVAEIYGPCTTVTERRF